MQSILSKIQDAVKQQDLFGVPVQLTYKGERTFITAFGGCVSLLMIIGLSMYFTYELQQEYSDPSYASTPNAIDYTKQKD